jgi:hypothetical protein
MKIINLSKRDLLAVLPPMAIFVLLVGCSSEKTSPKGNASKGAGVSGTTEEDLAREKLKMALDSWVFGDDGATFEKDHPEVKFLDSKLDKLMKYELGAGRKFQGGHEFAVVLIFEGKTGREIKESRSYWVTRNPKGECTIMKTPR